MFMGVECQRKVCRRLEKRKKVEREMRKERKGKIFERKSCFLFSLTYVILRMYVVLRKFTREGYVRNT